MLLYPIFYVPAANLKTVVHNKYSLTFILSSVR